MVKFIVEENAFLGVKRVAVKVAHDFVKVFGVVPKILSCDERGCANDSESNFTVVFAALGRSAIADGLVKENKFDFPLIKNKREVYQIKFISDDTLLICGSDKRGTIYGMFALSEYIGVSPLHFWGDVEPVRKEKIDINKDIEIISKEPSVKYRGFFINDEWPCFGTWTFNNFGGFTSLMYDHVFELLLRLKGNCLWPAMWSSSFALDGPGNLNEELADIYGVVIGSSHHEMCLRASEEWEKVRGKDSPYGNEWNYYTNKEGLLKYWEDALVRSGKYEKIITIGMRGEYDSKILGEKATVKDNVELLKSVIKDQRALIKKNAPDSPELLVLYKEVEEFFYGQEEIEGLKNWDELDDVILMLCEDNFGFMRTLPSSDIRDRQGGFGMYYHLDYHGAPVSYEWMPSVQFEKIWEQMSTAYDYGVREAWIVNVGDIKFNEVPLSYFLTLACDFEKWGTNNLNSIDEYTSKWLSQTFPSAGVKIRGQMAEVLHGYIRVNAMRRPEALNAGIYHPCHYLEADRMLNLADQIDTDNEDIYSALGEKEKDAFYSMIYLPAKASVNLLRMHLYAGKNAHYAKQGKKIANIYADLVFKCLELDKQLMREFSEFKNEKWKGMELGQHIGFVKWNDDNYRYPLRTIVEPAHKPRLCVTRKDEEKVYSKTYGSPMTVLVDDFLYEGNETVLIEIANDGIGTLDYVIEQETPCTWLSIYREQLTGNREQVGINHVEVCVEFQDEIELICDRSKLSFEKEESKFLIKTDDATVAVLVKGRKTDTSQLPPKTHLQNKGIIVIPSNQYYDKKDLPCGAFTELNCHGRSRNAMKVFPSTAVFSEEEESPSLYYRFFIEEEGGYTIEIWTTPANPVAINQPIRFLLQGGNQKHIVTTVPSDFKAGNYNDSRWCQGVLDNIRKTKSRLVFEKGVQEISIGALEPNFIPEKIYIYKEENAPKESYLGPD